nr:MAG TPA: hypothetical protein [Caudoviricetes sp.]
MGGMKPSVARWLKTPYHSVAACSNRPMHL